MVIEEQVAFSLKKKKKILHSFQFQRLILFLEKKFS